ncbi:unnamed protein product [Nippostrongylus brasiliensis]|uniref:Integrase_H2C2 domain-containing protein n=1 Tax=Nippostrongylus brasiliensis TaxID=27835 RepID=A0A0N4XN81_NIPBR|nr:unnamed protein product [Nippostrongylus brasiliensis]
MNLRDYVSNSKELNQFIKQEEGCDIDEGNSILGLRWDINTDEIEVKFPHNKLDKSASWTKRKVLQHAASVYDPYGWISPVTLIGKLFIHKLWTQDLAWDEVLSGSLLEEWNSIIQTWTRSSIKLPRVIISNSDPDTKYEIHVFVDASQAAYSAVSYLTELKGEQRIRASLLTSKSRLAPKKPSMTIPKLELSGLLIGANLIQYLKKQLNMPIAHYYLWSDSKVAIAWTKNNKELPVFVRNRVNIINKNTEKVKILHVPGQMNPADIASRGCTIEQLMADKLWWNGPDFLLKDESTWPKTDLNESCVLTNESHLISSSSVPNPPSLQPMMEVERFSSWNRILNTMTYVLKFITKVIPSAVKLFGNSTIHWNSKAEIILFRIAQFENPPTEELHYQLKLYQCDEKKLLRVQTRIRNAALPYETTHPILLPRKTHITSLFVLYTHTKNFHCGNEQTLVELRKTVWIPKGRTEVKRIINKHCFVCKKMKPRPYKLPDFPIYPSFRVNKPNYPFENCGMDMLGPVQHRSDTGNVEKCWILLWTCLSCRAIVVDVIKNMSSNTFLHSLRRFIATNGCPKLIISDNATTFKAFSTAQETEPVFI